jgi:phage gpG-like protein
MGFGIDVKSGGLGGFSTHVELDPQAMADLLRSPTGLVMRDMMRRATNVKRTAQQLVGVDTGRLRDSIVTRPQPAEMTVLVGSDVPYAVWHHEGSDAVHGKLMTWIPERGGPRIFRMSRRAIPGNPFLTNALAQAGD